MSRRAILLCATALLQCAQLWGQSISNPLLGAQSDGRENIAICQDTSGFVWVYTPTGMLRYDGSRVRNYQLPRSHFRGMQQYSTLLCTRDGRVVLTTNEGKVYRYDPRRDTFVAEADLYNTFQGVSVQSFLVDSEDRYVFGTTEGVFVGLQEHKPACLSGQRVLALLESTDSTMYAGTEEGLYRITREEGSYKEEYLIGLPTGTIENLVLYRSKILIGTFSGLYIWDMESNSLSRATRVIPPVSITALMYADEHRVYVGTDGNGLYLYNIDEDSVVSRYTHSDDNESESLRNDTVLGLSRDNHGRIWVATATGVSVLDSTVPDCGVFRHIPGESESIRSNYINDVYEDSDLNLWFATNDGITRFNRERGEYKTFLSDGEVKNRVNTICGDPKRGVIWVGGFNMPVTSIDIKSGETHSLPLDKSLQGYGISSLYTYALRVVGDELWVGGIEGPLTRYSITGTSPCQYYSVVDVKSISLFDEQTLMLTTDHDFELISMSDGTMNKFSSLGGIRIQSRVVDGIRDSDGLVWLATDGDGVICYDFKSRRVRQFTREDGMETVSFNSIAEDDKGRIWMTGDDKIYYYSKSEDRVVPVSELLSRRDGIFTSSALCVLKSGHILSGTTAGALYFDPERVQTSTQKGRLYFYEFNIDSSGQREDETTLFDLQSGRASKLALSYRQNSFSIGFSNLNLMSPGRVTFEYELKGHDPQPISCERPMTVRYAGVRPGHYTFRVEAIDKYTGVSIDELELPLRIKPHPLLS